MTTKTKSDHTGDDLFRQLQSTPTRRMVTMHVRYFPHRRRSKICAERFKVARGDLSLGGCKPVMPVSKMVDSLLARVSGTEAPKQNLLTDELRGGDPGLNTFAAQGCF
jgi:hypothetical protein